MNYRVVVIALPLFFLVACATAVNPLDDYEELNATTILDAPTPMEKLEFKYPGVIYPAYITPDAETGIGNWSNRQIADAIKAGVGRHGTNPISVMPWQSFARLTDADINQERRRLSVHA